MAHPIRTLTPEYQAAQLAGSSRLEGIRVSAAQEQMMISIIRGDTNEEEVIRTLKSRFASGRGMTVVR
jgi:hypothetical protein